MTTDNSLKYEAIYSRQSIDKKDSVSIEAQIDVCRPYLTSEKHELYIDKGWSGKNTDRPKMNKLIADVKSNKISKIIAYRLDRISRNIVDFGNLLTLFNEHNVEFVSATENFDTSSPMGRAMVYIVMVFAQLERETIASRITDNYKFRCSTGKYFMGGGVPFGYQSIKTTIDGKKASIIIPNDNSVILQEIFNRFISGDSITSIVKDLNQRGLRTNNDKLWSALAIKRILQNITPCTADEPIYNYLSAYGYNITNSIDEFDGTHGMCIFLKQKSNHVEADISEQVVVIGVHEPLISSDKFIKAQLLLERNKDKTSPKTSKNTFLAGMIKCKECGYSFGMKSMTKGNRKYLYYLCRSRLSKGVCDNSLYITAENLEETVLKDAIEYLSNYLQNIPVSEEENTSNSNQLDEIHILEMQIENLINNIGKGNSVVDGLLTNKITEIQNKINSMKMKIQVSLHSEPYRQNNEELLNELLSFDKYDIYRKSDIIKKIIDYIEISKTGKVRIHYLIRP
jgi:DNA invertase Pin-like site-specific DNA recombinase